VADLGANGGPLIDLHIHDVNFILYLLGMPAQVFATGQTKEDFINYVAANFHYPGGPTVSAQSGAVTMKSRMFMHQFEAYFENATVAHGSASEPEGIDYAAQQGASQRVTVYRADGSVDFPELDLPEAFTAELTHAAECVASGQASEIINARQAVLALGVIEQLAQSVFSGQPVRCEPVA
jgi:predicted dehydrogenase